MCVLAASWASCARAATYYVSPSGDDTHLGTSPATAWRSLTKVNNTQMKPGDQVLLEGGQTFEGPLVPWGNGSTASPVVFTSYGIGRATVSSQTNNVVFLHAINNVAIQNLRLTTNGADNHVIVGDPSTTSTNIAIKNNLITNTAAFGINSPSFADSGWTIQGNTISETGETAVTFRGRGFRVIGNVISDSGMNPSEAAHAVYAKGPDATVIGNTITNFDSSGISIRYRNSIVQGNVITGGLIGISYFQEPDATPGTSTIAYNKIDGVTVCGIYLDGSKVEGFVIVDNTIRTTGGNGINFHQVKRLTFANNIVAGTFAGPVVLLWKSQSAYSERNNLFYPAAGQALLWNGASMTLAQYKASAHQGAGDATFDPQLDASETPANPAVVDAGAKIGGVAYKSTCNGSPFSFCDRAPDMGAVERKARKRKAGKRVKSSG